MTDRTVTRVPAWMVVLLGAGIFLLAEGAVLFVTRLVVFDPWISDVLRIMSLGASANGVAFIVFAVLQARRYLNWLDGRG